MILATWALRMLCIVLIALTGIGLKATGTHSPAASEIAAPAP